MFSRWIQLKISTFNCELITLLQHCPLKFLVVSQVCDQPHPLHVKNMVRQVLEGKFDDACTGMKQLYDLGYSPTDIITTLFRIIKNYDMAEYLKLEFMKVCPSIQNTFDSCIQSANLAIVLILCRKLDLLTWGFVTELVHIFRCVVYSQSLLWLEKLPKQFKMAGKNQIELSDRNVLLLGAHVYSKTLGVESRCHLLEYACCGTWDI